MFYILQDGEPGIDLGWNDFYIIRPFIENLDVEGAVAEFSFPDKPMTTFAKCETLARFLNENGVECTVHHAKFVFSKDQQ